MKCEQCGEIFEDVPGCNSVFCPKCEDYNDFMKDEEADDQ